MHCLELAYLFAENLFYRCESGLEYLHPPGELRKKPGQLCFGTCTSTGRWPWNCTTQPGPPGGVGGAPCSLCGWQLRSISWASKLKDGNLGPPILLMDV